MQYHPVINFMYFLVVIGCSMFLMHPICLGISLLGAFAFILYLFGWQRSKKGLAVLVPVMLLTALINPAFSHQGVTVLAYLPSGNVLTRESVLYGLAAACLLGSTLLWFRAAGEILTADNIVYLFGKGFPVMGLMLSMLLGFVPKIQRKYVEIRMAGQERRKREEQILFLRYGRTKFQDRIRLFTVRHILSVRCGVQYLSLLITWMLEDAVETADSMKGRGYGLEGRTSFTRYRFTKRDGRALVTILLSAGYVLLGYRTGGIKWDYFPQTEGAGFGAYSISIYLVYLLLCMMPVIESGKGESKWNRLKSVI